MISAHDPEHRNQSPNRLISEKSPYLLQHAYNPVNWYPWGPEAFEAAQQRRINLFFFLSDIQHATGVMSWKKSLSKIRK